MQKSNTNGALKVLTNEMSNGILPVTEEALSQVEIKHPDNRDASADVLLNGPIKEIHPIVFDPIDEMKKWCCEQHLSSKVVQVFLA